jgi:serine/threonine protein kinase/Flp pilus assembly protein TadD
MSTIYGVGDSIKGVFRVQQILEGGMGVVYICHLLPEAELGAQVRIEPRKPEQPSLAEDNSRRYMAIKTFHRELLWHPEVADGFQRECLTWITLLPHPNIVKAKTVDLIGAYLHLWLEYIDGGSLREQISRGPLALETAISIALQFCAGMEFLFQSGPIIHRDIKPENTLLTKSGTVKITDFGLAAALAQKHERETKPEEFPGAVIAGTVPYMSPEQFSASEVDVRSDIYGFGVMFYEMMTGRRPFQASEFEEYRRLHEKEIPVPPKHLVGTPDGIDRVILKCLEKRPENRSQTFTEVRLALEEFCKENGMTRLIVAPPSWAHLEANMDAEDWTGRGYALAKLDRFEESTQCYRKALELDPEGIGRNINMGTGLTRVGKKEEALAYFEREVKLHPDKAIFYAALGNHYMELGRNEDALAATQKSTEIDPEGIARWRMLGFICLKMKREEEARKVWEHIKKLLLTVPQYRNPMSVNNEAIISANTGATEVALQMHEFGTEHYPDSGLIWYNFGVTLHRLGRIEQAIACYSRALELDGSLSFASLNRALLLLEVEDWKDAKSDLEATRNSDPESTAGQLANTLLEIAQQLGPNALGMFARLGASLKYIM